MNPISQKNKYLEISVCASRSDTVVRARGGVAFTSTPLVRILPRSTQTYDILRHSVEIGLLALGNDADHFDRRHRPFDWSLLGLCAILFRQAMAGRTFSDLAGWRIDNWDRCAGGCAERPPSSPGFDCRR